MAHKQGGYRSKTLIFPNNWTGKWLYHAIINTPKWQINSILNSYKFAEWVGFESTYLNGLRLPERSSPEENYIRSVMVGVKVSQASREYNSMMNKVGLEDKVELLKDELEAPVLGDMIKSLTQAVVPSPTNNITPLSLTKVETPEITVKEKGKEIPVEILS